MSERDQLLQAIAALEAQRGLLGDAVVDAALGSMRAQLATVQAPPPEQQRKLVSMLFADVVGSTALGEHMDAEDVSELMNALWQQIDTLITQHGGYIDKHLGDGVMALWGAQTAREDDPEQAIRAALAMQQALAAFRAEHQIALAMRIGLNTGPVLLGAVATTQEFTAMGDAVNLASRMEQAAPPDGVLISHDTYRHVRGLFEVRPLPPITVKGKQEPIPVYLVERVKPRSFFPGTRGVEGVETRMVGRQAELGQLQQALQAVIASGELQAISVVGEAGVGKSRLLYEFRSWLELQEQRVQLFVGRATQEMQSLPYALLRAIFALRFGIQESDPVALAREKLELGIAALLGRAPHETAMQAHMIGQLLGFDFSTSPHLHGIVDDARQIRDRALHYLSQLFAAVSQEQPVVLAVEDLHWADDASLDALSELLQRCQHLPLLLLYLTRPRLYERRPAWGEGQAGHTRLTLIPLSKHQSRQLVAEILQHLPVVPEALRELVVSGAEGNPFYVEELIKMLIEEGVIVPGAQAWQVEAGRLAAVKVPPTLTGVLQARLDSLPSAERDTLQRASVIGRVFWDAAIRQLQSGEVSDEGEHLAQLRRRELVYRRELSSFTDAREYLFKHALLREVTYESILKRQRRVYHAQAARWLIQAAGERAEEYAGLIAEHYQRAGERAHAGGWFVRAGRQAQATYANETAIAAYLQALELLPEAEQGPVLLALGEVLELLGRYEAAVERYQAALALAAQRGQVRELARCHHALGVLLRKRGDYPEAQTWLDQALSGYAAGDDRAGRCQVLLELGYLYGQQREYHQAQTYTEAGLALAREIGDKRALALALHVSGMISVGFDTTDSDRLQAAWAFTEEALLLRRELGDKAASATSLNNLGHILEAQGNYPAASAYYEEALSVAREIGDKRAMAFALRNLGDVAKQESYPAARTRYEQGLVLFREIGDKHGVNFSLAALGNLSYDHGEYEQAQLYYQQRLAHTQMWGPKWTIPPRLRLGQVALALGQPALARHHGQAALALAQELGEQHGLSDALCLLGRVLYLEGDRAGAQALFEQALGLAREVHARRIIGSCLQNQGMIALDAGQLTRAQEYYQEALSLTRERLERREMGQALLGLAAVTLAQLADAAHARRAVLLAAAGKRLLEITGLVWEPLEAGLYERTLAAAQAALDAATFATAWAEGQALTLEQALTVASERWEASS